jgi:hypothetical protein
MDKLNGTLDVALDNASVRKRLLDLGCDIPDKAQRGQETLLLWSRARSRVGGRLSKQQISKTKREAGSHPASASTRDHLLGVRNSD